MKIDKYFKSIQKQNARILILYWLFCAFRVILVFIPQYGFIHPDEFFQSVEPMAGDEFNLEVVRTWEFNASFPIRSVFFPIVLVKVPYNLLRLLNLYTDHFLGISLLTSYAVLVIPRLAMCAISFINDYSLYRICKVYGLNYDFRLLIMASSYITLVFGSRTFSNTIEMVLCSLLLFVVSDCMLLSHSIVYQNEVLDEEYDKAEEVVDRARIVRLKSSLPSHTFNKCFIISTICAAGIFNRPTFIAFGFPIVFFWILRGLGSKSITFVDFNFRIILLAIAIVPSLLFFTIVDSLYYNYLTLPEIERLEIGINNFVFTPLNFIKYNLDSSKTAQHGVHPWYMHTLVNIPLLFNILGVATIFTVAAMVFRFCKSEYRQLPRVQSVVGLMTAAIVSPVVCLSLINHQEPRFLIPILLPVILLHGTKLHSGFCKTNPFETDNLMTRYIYETFLSHRSAKKFLKLWYIVNIILTLFFGFCHQGGVVQLGRYFNNHILPITTQNSHIHLMTSHVYNLPLSLLFMPSAKRLYVNPETGQKYRKEKNIFLHEHGNLNMADLYKKMKLIMDINEFRIRNNKSKAKKYKIYLAIPASLSHDLNFAFYNSNNTVMRYRQIRVFYPHLSTEAMPDFFAKHPCDVNTDFFEIDSTCDAASHSHDDDSLSVSSILHKISSTVHQFGLVLYRIEMNAIPKTV